MVATLEDVATLCSTAGLKAGDARAVGSSEPWMSEFADGHFVALTTFMQVLTAGSP